MSPFDLLGIGADADERTIKSAYAKLLRSTRPDEDAEGFQRLNEAYQRALAIWRVRNGASRNAWQQSPPVVVQFTGAQPAAGTNDRQDAAAQAHTPAEDRPNHPLTKPADATHWQTAQQAQPAFNFQAFLDRYRQHAEAGEPRILEEWLVAEPGLWHLPTKQAVGRHLLKVLFENPVPTTGDCLDITLDFFKFNDALSGVDPIFLNRLRHRTLGAWQILPEHLRDLSLRLYGSSRSLKVRNQLKAFCRSSARPFRWPSVLLSTLQPGSHARRFAYFLSALSGGNLDDLPRNFDQKRARFRVEAVQRRLNRTRLIIFAFRSGLTLILPLLLLGVAYFGSSGNLSAIEIRGILLTACTIAYGLLAIAWSWIGAVWLLDKFDELASRSPAAKAVRLGLTPALCISSLAIAQLMDHVLGTIAAIISMFFAFWRYRARHGIKIDASARIGLIIVFGFCTSALSSLVSAHESLAFLPAVLVSLVALAIWALDMKKLYWRSFARRRAST